MKETVTKVVPAVKTVDKVVEKKGNATLVEETEGTSEKTDEKTAPEVKTKEVVIEKKFTIMKGKTSLPTRKHWQRSQNTRGCDGKEAYHISMR